MTLYLYLLTNGIEILRIRFVFGLKAKFNDAFSALYELTVYKIPHTMKAFATCLFGIGVFTVDVVFRVTG